MAATVVLFLSASPGAAADRGKKGNDQRPVIPGAEEMVLEKLVPTKMLSNVDVLRVMMRTDRSLFVPKDMRAFAFQDITLPIGSGQTISPPLIVAYMTEVLQPNPNDRVLEIGTGSGYQAAILSPLVKEVYTIEIIPSLGKRAGETLRKLGYANVKVKIGDGYQGWSENAPFDKIIVTCSPENIPQPLIDQLAEGGMMLIPIGERYQQFFYRCIKENGELKKEKLIPAYFVPMTGEAEQQRQVQPDPTNP
ncbi:MAG: protein-L-isoaspartate(D-aspartate) O-methyltransferase, partial [Thermoguttaceae bacterium]|nr:protein-L-isoaspartate(D-aspartate) O-methyltransferase [Thermoguttaceae bacterium]